MKASKKRPNNTVTFFEIPAHLAQVLLNDGTGMLGPQPAPKGTVLVVEKGREKREKRKE